MALADLFRLPRRLRPTRSQCDNHLAAGIPQLIFVGGAPRSGTTITQALICTSASVNDYSTEVSFLTQLIRGYQVGLDTWAVHTRHHFADAETFRALMRRTADISIRHIAEACGNPRLLCLKDPHLTALFPIVAELYPCEARFVTTVRHPYAVVRSRQEVAERAGEPFGSEQVRHVCKQYLDSYRHIEIARLKGRLCHFRYEDLLQRETLVKLRDFTGCDDIDYEAVWGRLRKPAGARSRDRTGNAWFSPKYRRPIDLDSRLGDLDWRLKKIVDAYCARHMQRFGYACETT